MAFPVVEDRLPQAFDTPATSFDVDLPATVDANDLLLIYTGTPSDNALNTPSGWDLIANGGGGVSVSRVYAKVANGTEGGTSQTFTSGGSGGKLSTVVDRISNFSGSISLDIDVSPGQFALPPGVDPNPVSAGWGSDDNLFIASHMGGGSGIAVSWSAFSANYGNTAQIVTSGNETYVGICDRSLVSDNDDPGAWTGTGAGQGITFTFVVRPGSVVPPAGPPPSMFMKNTLGSNLIDGPMIR